MNVGNVSDQIVATLTQAGIRRIYGIVGDSLNGINEALRHQKAIEWIHVRHEEVAAFAAAGEAQITGKLAVCAGSCGPGNLHLINGLFDAHRELGRPFWRLPPTYPLGRSGLATFRKLIPRISSGSVVIIASLFLTLRSFHLSSKTQSALLLACGEWRL